MAQERDDRLPALDNHLPALSGPVAWLKVIAFFALLIAFNVAGFLLTFGLGILATLPLTLLMGFLLARELLPRHRLPPGRIPGP